jgi:hypothetical protein
MKILFYSKVEGEVPKSTIEDIVTLIHLIFCRTTPENYSLTTAFMQLIDFLVIKGIVQKNRYFCK